MVGTGDNGSGRCRNFVFDRVTSSTKLSLGSMTFEDFELKQYNDSQKSLQSGELKQRCRSASRFIREVDSIYFTILIYYLDPYNITLSLIPHY